MEKRRKIIYSALYSGLISSMNVSGCYLSVKYSTFVFSNVLADFLRNLSFFGYVLFYICSFSALFLMAFLILGKVSKDDDGRKIHIPSSVIVLIFLGLIICWLPTLFAVFPGFFNYDIEGQLPQVMYRTGYVTHHSLLSTLIMGAVITVGYHLFDENIVMGIFCYSCFQMIFCSIVFTLCICYLYKISHSRVISVLSFLYYGFSPVITMFALSTTKDVICSCFLLISTLLIYDFWANVGNDEKQIRYKEIALVVSLILMALMRKNGIIAVILFGGVLLLSKWKKKRAILLIVASVLGYFVIAFALKSGLHAKSGGSVEAFSVPIQQIARVYADKGKEAFSEDEWKLIDRVTDEERLSQYNPFLADHIKNYLMFDEVEKSPVSYAKLWLEVGIRHPKEYVNALLDLTYQFWYPWTLVVEDPDSGSIDYFDFEMSLDIERTSYLPSLYNQLKRLAETDYYQKIPMVRLLLSTGFMFWLTATQLWMGLFTREDEKIWPAAMVLFYCFSSAMGPESLVRYYLILYYYFPLAVAFILDAISVKTEST